MTVFIFLVGLAIGSFLNVCIHRLPRGESVVVPPSHCGRCGAFLKPRDLIPVLSFILLRGRCRYCREPVSRQYPLVEAVTGGLFVFLFWRFGAVPELFRYLALAAGLIVVVFVDLEHYRIPNAVVLFLLVAGVAMNLVTGGPGLPAMAMGALAGGGPLYLLGLFYGPQGMGGGDVKLGAALGVVLGWPLVWLALFLAALGGTAVGAPLIMTGRLTRRDSLPFGPFLAAGAMAAVFWGQGLLQWYLAWPGLLR